MKASIPKEFTSEEIWSTADQWVAKLNAKINEYNYIVGMLHDLIFKSIMGLTGGIFLGIFIGWYNRTSLNGVNSSFYVSDFLLYLIVVSLIVVISMSSFLLYLSYVRLKRILAEIRYEIKDISHICEELLQIIIQRSDRMKKSTYDELVYRARIAEIQSSIKKAFRVIDFRYPFNLELR